MDVKSTRTIDIFCVVGDSQSFDLNNPTSQLKQAAPSLVRDAERVQLVSTYKAFYHLPKTERLGNRL